MDVASPYRYKIVIVENYSRRYMQMQSYLNKRKNISVFTVFTTGSYILLSCRFEIHPKKLEL